MKLDRSQKAILNFISSFGLTLVTFLTAMISSRLVISYIGDERFGAYRSLFDLFGYLNLLEAGISASLRPLLAKALAQPGSEEVPGLLKFGQRMFRLGMIVHFIVGVGFAIFSFWLIPVSPVLRQDLLIGSIIFTLGLFNLTFCTTRCLCETLQNAFLVNLLLMFQSVCVTFTSMILCRMAPDWGISLLAFSLVFWVIQFNFILWFIMRPEFKRWPLDQVDSRNSRLSVRNWLVHGRDTFLLMLSGRASLHSNNLFLGFFHGQVDVTRLYATQRLFDVVQTQLFAIGNSSWAALAEIYHSNQHERFRSRVLQLIRLILVLGIAVIVPIFFFNADFVRLWVGSSRFGGQSASLILAFQTLALGFTVFSTWCLMGTGYLKPILKLTFVTSILDVIATVTFTRPYGIIGPVLGTTTVFYLVAIPWHLKLLQSHFQIRIRTLSRLSVPVIFSIPIYVMILSYLKSVVQPENWLQLAMVLGFPALSYLVMIGLLLFRDEEWNLILGRFLPFLKKKGSPDANAKSSGSQSPRD